MIIFLHGPETFRSRQKLKEITSSYEKAHQHQVRSFYFDCKETSLVAIQSALETISLFERKKLIVLENSFQNASVTAWLQEQKQALQKSEQHIVAIFETAEIKQKTQNRLYQWLKKNAKQQEFLPLAAAQLKLWIEKEFAGYGLQIAPLATEQLARAAGNDMWRLSGEIRKIAAYKKSGASKQVKESDIELFVDPRLEADIFATIDAAASRNTQQAFGLVWRHLKKGESPQYLFSMLQYQFRTLLEIRDLLDKKLSRQEMVSETKLHPYVLQKSLRVAERFSLAELKHVYQKLFQLDWQQKTGRVDPAGSLTTFLATL